MLKVIATSAIPPAMGPLWSVEGTEIVSLHSTTPIKWGPGEPFEGKAQISVATVVVSVMDGHKFLGQLRNIAEHRRIPVVVFSAVCAGPTLEGAQAVMQKPFEMDALLGRVSGLLALTH